MTIQVAPQKRVGGSELLILLACQEANGFDSSTRLLGSPEPKQVLILDIFILIRSIVRKLVGHDDTFVLHNCQGSVLARVVPSPAAT